MAEPETNETDGSYYVAPGFKEKKAARKSEMEGAASFSRRMDEPQPRRAQHSKSFRAALRIFAIRHKMLRGIRSLVLGISDSGVELLRQQCCSTFVEMVRSKFKILEYHKYERKVSSKNDDKHTRVSRDVTVTAI